MFFNLTMLRLDRRRSEFTFIFNRIIYRQLSINIIPFEKIDSIIKNEKKENTSALYASKSPKKKNAYSLFQYSIKQDFRYLNEIFKNLDDYKLNLKARRIESINLNQLQSDYELVKKNENEIENLEMKKTYSTNTINFKIKNTFDKSEKDKLLKSDEIKSLINECKFIDNKIESLQTLEFHLFDEFYVNSLKLPNLLHPNAPLDDNSSILFESKNEELPLEMIPFNFNSKWSFRLQPNDITSHYLCGDYAKLELVLMEYFRQKLRNFKNFEYIKSASLIKSALIEGCGDDFYNSEKFFNSIDWTIGGKSNKNFMEIMLLHFTGTSSLYSLILSFVNSTIKSASLPRFVYTCGRNNEPYRGHVNQFDILAICSNDQLLSNKNLEEQIKNKLTVGSNLSCDKLFNENDSSVIFTHFVSLLSSLYKELNIHYRVVSVAAHLLKSSECYKITFDAFVKNEGKFKTVSIIACEF